MKENVIKDKSYQFALMVIDLSKYLIQRNEFVLSRQLLRSGTSIGANVEEALAGQSRADFLSKMSIASKEAREANYWLRLLRDSNTCDEIGLDLYCLNQRALLTSSARLLKQPQKIRNYEFLIVVTTAIQNPELRIQN